MAEELLYIPQLEFTSIEIDEMENEIENWGLSISLRSILKLNGYLTPKHYENMSAKDILNIFNELDVIFNGEKAVLRNCVKQFQIKRVSILYFF